MKSLIREMVRCSKELTTGKFNMSYVQPAYI